MATYREVVNVPSVPGTDELIPQPWAIDVIDYGIAHGYINTEDTHRDDWLEIVGSGRYWTFEYRQNMPERVDNLESDVVALAATSTSQLNVNALALETHDAILNLLEVQDAQVKALQSRATTAEEQIANILLLLGATDQPPPVGDWWVTQKTAAVALRTVTRGPRTPDVRTPPVTLTAGLHEDLQITDVYAGRSLWLADGTEVAWSEIRNGGRVDLGNTSDRDQMVSHPWPTGTATVRDSIITDSQWTGIGTGNDGLILRCELARNTLTGVTFFYGIAEASLGKFWDSVGLFVEDCWVHDQQAMGPWWDGQNATGGGIRGGLFERCGNNNQGVATYFELGGGFICEDATFFDNDTAIRVQTDGLTIRRVVVEGRNAVYGINENRPDRAGRPVTVDVQDSYFDLTAFDPAVGMGVGYGWDDFGGPGPTSFTSENNWFKLTDPGQAVFRDGSGALKTFAQWQATGRDLSSVLV